MGGDSSHLRWRGRSATRPHRRLLARDVFRLVFYLPEDHSDLAPGVSRALDRYLSAVGEGPGRIHDVSLSLDEGGRLTPERWSRVRQLLRDTTRWSFPADYEAWEQRDIQKRRFERGLLFTGGFGLHHGYALEYRARIPWRPESEDPGVSLLTATLPLSFLEEKGPGYVRQLALDMAAPLPFATGHAGLALRILGPLSAPDAAFRAEILRLPGIDLREAWGHEESVGLQVDGIHWLNFLGPPVIDGLGGSQALRSRLRSEQTSVVELGRERAMVCLGARPEAGGLCQGKTLTAYQELAQVLRPWLEPFPSARRTSSDEAPRYTPLQLTEDEARQWWSRFSG